MEKQTDTIEIRRDARVAGVIGGLALVVAALFLLRGTIPGIVVGVILLVVAGVHLWSVWDSRVPLLLVDEQGVRIRLGRTWRGIPWSQVHEIEHTPRPGGVRQLWHDGRLAVLPVDESAQVGELTGVGRRWARLSERLYGVPFAVPLGLSTRVTGDGGDLTAALAALAGPRTGIVVIDESLEPETGSMPAVTTATAQDSASVAEQTHRRIRLSEEVDTAQAAGPVGAAEAPATEPMPTETVAPDPVDEPVREPVSDHTRVAPLRAITQPVRVDVSYDAPIAPLTPEDTGRIPRITADLLESGSHPTHDSGIIPAATPVIGPQLAAARERIGLSVDQLAERTRIRPHVIEAIEVDDFAPCGGDFYARGHLRTLARVLGLDATPLLATYDETYADAPVDPRAVFQAELASGSGRSLRKVNGGPNWSVLVAAVMAIVLVWSVARLVTAHDRAPKSDAAMTLQAAGSDGRTNPYGKLADPVPVTLTAAGGGAHVVVRDGSGKVVYNGDLAFGQSKTLQISPPVRVQSGDGSVQVAVDGQPAAAMGKTGESTQRTYTVG